MLRSGLCAFAVFSLTFCLGIGQAEARAAHESPYTYRQTFGTALRLIKVDLAMRVLETNSEWGFFIFEYRSPASGKRKNRGTVQFVKQSAKVQVAVDVPQMPLHHEQMLVDKLKRKLSQDHGSPPRAPKTTEKPKDDEPERKKSANKKVPPGQRDRRFGRR